MLSRRPIVTHNRGRVASVVPSAGAPPAPIVTTPLDLPGLTSWWLMSTSLTADQGPGGNALTAVGSPATSSMSLDGQTAYLLDGVDDYLHASGTAATALQGPHVVWAVIELVANASGSKEIFGAYNTGASAQRDQVRWAASSATNPFTPGAWSLVRQGDTGGAATITAQDAVELATLVVLKVHTGTETRVYVNRALQQQSAVAHVANSATFDRFVIGASLFSGVAADFANIRVAEAGVVAGVPSDAYLDAFWTGYLWPRWIDTDEEMMALMTTSGQRNNANTCFRQYAHQNKTPSGATDGNEYVCNWDANDGLFVGKHALGSRTWEVAKTLYRPGGAYQTATSRSGTSPDNHNAVVLTLLENGRLALSGGEHAVNCQYAIAPAAGSLAIPAPTAGPWVAAATNENSVSYTQFVPLPNGTVRRIHRQGDAGAANTILTTVSSSGVATAFKNPLIDGFANVPDVNAYIYRVVVHRLSSTTWREHYFWGWRETGTASTAYDVCYACIDESGNVWQDPACTIPQTVPITTTNCNTIKAIGQVAGMREAGGATVDENGVPMCVVGHCLPANGTPHNWQPHVLRWNGATWDDILCPVIENPVHDASDQTTCQVLAKGGVIRVLWVANTDTSVGINCASTSDLGTTWSNEVVYAGQSTAAGVNGVGVASAVHNDRRFREDDVLSLFVQASSNSNSTRSRAGICEVSLTDRAPQTLVGTGGVTPWCALEEVMTLGTRGVTQWTDTSGNGRHFAPTSPTTIGQQPFRFKRGAPGLWPMVRGGTSASGAFRHLILSSGMSAPGTSPILVIGIYELLGWVINRVIFAGQTNSVTALRLFTSTPQVGPTNGTSGPLRNAVLGRPTFFAMYFSNSANDRWWHGSESNITSGVSFGNTAPTAFGCFATSAIGNNTNSGLAMLHIIQGLNSTDAGNCVTAYKAAIAAKYASTIPYARNALII